MRDLTPSLRQKRPDMEIEGIIFHHDSASAHLIDMQETIDFQGMERIAHTPYSPDLAPMDFVLFPRLKADLHGKDLPTWMVLVWRLG